MKARLLIIAVFVLATALLSGCGTEVPDVTGMTVADASKTVKAVGLELAIPTYDNKPSSEHGRVVSQTPAAGERLNEGAVEIVLAGFPPMPVPSATGLSKEEAESAINSAGLTVGEVNEEFNETVPKGKVISQEPSAGAEVQKGDEVALVVSKGRQPIAIPSVVGKSQQEATKLLKTAGFKVKMKAEDSSKKKGTVLAQTPSKGKAVPGASVVLTVSSGVQMVTVPNVNTMFFSDAEARLRRAGFRVNTIGVYAGDGGLTTDGTIYKQSPRAGSSIPQGSLVTIWYGYETS